MLTLEQYRSLKKGDIVKRAVGWGKDGEPCSWYSYQVLSYGSRQMVVRGVEQRSNQSTLIKVSDLPLEEWSL